MISGPIKRGCGYRVEGGVYAEVPLAPGGSALEAFMYCQPKTHIPNNRGVEAPVVDAWGLSPRGVTLVSLYGKVHVVDWVGRESYPNPSDILEEIRRFGLSRRLELSEADYSLLGPGSMIILLHAWGSKLNATDYALASRDLAEPRPCPKHHEHHERHLLTEMCACLHWEGVIGGEANIYDRSVRRVVGETEYFAYEAPEGVSPEMNEPALIAAFPINRLAVIKHSDAAKQAEAVERASKTAFDLSLEDY